VPGRRLWAHGGNRGLDIAAGEPRPHPCQVDAVGFPKAFEEPAPDEARPRPEDPGSGEIHKIERAVRCQQYIAVVEIRERHSATVELIEDGRQAVEEGVVQQRPILRLQRLCVDPLGGEGTWAQPPEERRQGGHLRRSLVGRSFLTATR